MPGLIGHQDKQLRAGTLQHLCSCSRLGARADVFSVFSAATLSPQHFCTNSNSPGPWESCFAAFTQPQGELASTQKQPGVLGSCQVGQGHSPARDHCLQAGDHLESGLYKLRDKKGDNLESRLYKLKVRKEMYSGSFSVGAHLLWGVHPCHMSLLLLT